MKEVIELLANYGGWATTVFLGYALIWLYRDQKAVIQAKDVLIGTINREHHQEIVAVVRECTAVLTTVHDSLERCEKRSGAGENNGSGTD